MRNIPDVALDCRHPNVSRSAITGSGWRWAAPAPRRLCGPASSPWRTSRQRRAESRGWDFSIRSSTASAPDRAYPSDLHDIATGNNSGFNALPGYDLATGWGTPAGQPLINSLTGAANSRRVQSVVVRIYAFHRAGSKRRQHDYRRRAAGFQQRGKPGRVGIAGGRNRHRSVPRAP